MAVELNGQIALVTGSAVRVGREISLALARDGCDLVLHYHRSSSAAKALAAEVEALGRRAVLVRADLSSAAQTASLARAAAKKAGRVDILINNAGIFWPTPLQKLTPKELDTFLDINLRGAYILSTELGAKMKSRGQGNIVNLACISAFRAWKDFVPYSISKAAVVALTQGMAKLLAPEVRVNAVAPGTVLPPEDMSADRVRASVSRIPLKRTGSAQDVADAVLYLLKASFVTGQVLCVDGGRSIV